MTLISEKSMLTREIHRVEKIVKVMKETTKLGNLEETLRYLRGRYADIEQIQIAEKEMEK